jgi:hypothetical protein
MRRAVAALDAREDVPFQGRRGVYLEVRSDDDRRLPDLTWVREHIRLGAIRTENEVVEVGALFVPIEARDFLETKVREYATEDTDGGQPRNNDKFSELNDVIQGSVRTLWTDVRTLPVAGQPTWWECWCWKSSEPNLLPAAGRLGLLVSDRRLAFPELTVIPVRATLEQMEQLLGATDAIEELRYADDNAAVFTRRLRAEQREWVADLAGRLEVAAAEAPVVSILDTGVARAHPLLEGSLAEDRCLTIDQNWGTDDHHPHGHGTNMAGAVLYGDLTDALAGNQPVVLGMRLESIKVLSPPGQAPNGPTNYGAITQSAVAIAEQHAPEDARIFCMPITNEDVSGERPSSWSAAIDQICAGVMPGDEAAAEPDEDANDDEPREDRLRRLFVVPAGNVPDVANPDEVSDLDEYPVEDPAQAWNALAIGGFTEKVDIDEADNLPGWTAYSAAGGHSSYSRISVDWEHSRTPIKPELVLEAGNRALSPAANELVSGVDSLSLLTTAKEFLVQPCVGFWATSVASAQAASMAAAISAEYPDLWPETVRALLVHSAEYTPAMLARFAETPAKSEHIRFARWVGYGVPRLHRALASAGSDVALVAESEIQPFKRSRDAKGRLQDPSYNEINYYKLPWPRTALEGLAERDVKLKVTLSYFIEPSPGEGAPVRPGQYQSHGLRFELKRRGESDQDFRFRMNDLEREVERPLPPEADDGWLFGSRSVAAGSLHCDTWTGSGAELATRDMLAVTPVGGWWRYRPKLGRVHSRTRYALVVTISTPDENIDLYAEISAQVEVPQVVQVRV